MANTFSEIELEAYLDESLPPARMAEIETALRDQPDMSAQLATINGRRDAGVHSLGEIWRRHRLTCPSREQLGSHLLGAAPKELTDYIRFHLTDIECRVCRANLDDLESQQADRKDHVESRRRKYFQSSAGYLRSDDRE
jgi:hypothetical protein